MKIKNNNIEFIAFNDGICKVYRTDDEDNKKYKYERLSYKRKVLGYGRHFSAMAVQVKVSAVIAVPFVKNISAKDIVTLQDGTEYEVVLVQEKDDTNPRSLDLTLSELTM